MATDVAHERVRERLATAMTAELEVAEALGAVARALDDADSMAEVERLLTLVRGHIASLGASGFEPDLPSTPARDSTGSRGRLSEAISSAQEALAAATRADAALHATARILYEPDVCDLAEEHLAHHIDGLQVMAVLLPGALAAELNAEGLFCHCVCPSCSIGACGCVRSSIGSVADVWGWPGLPVVDGVEQLSPPRPGSQLAAARIHQHDRIVSIDGVVVRSNPDVQAALRKHAPGETARLTVQRPTGELVEVPVKRADGTP